jgi:type II secretory pathway component PulK
MATTVNLAVTTRLLPDGTEDASIALRMIPTSIVDGAAVTDDANATARYRGSVGEISDPAEAAKVSALLAAIKALAGG